MKKDTNYYMSLPWKISMEKIPYTEGGGYNASIPQLGSLVYFAFGETEEVAIKHLQETTRKLFDKRLADGLTIEEPLK